MKQKPSYRRLSSYNDNRFYALSKSTVIKYDRLISMYNSTDDLYQYHFYNKIRKISKLSDMFKSRKAKPMYYYYDVLSIIPLSRAAKRSFYDKFIRNRQ